MSLIIRIKEDLKTALKSQNKEAAVSLRTLLAEIRNKQIELQAEPTDEQVMELVAKEVKKRNEAIEAYQKGNRPELVAKEQKEKELLGKYLPQQLSDDELLALIKGLLGQANLSSQADFGQAMGLVIPQTKGRADGNRVAAIVKKALSSGEN